MSVPEIAELVQALGVIGLLIVALVGAYRKWYVFGWVYQAQVRQTEFWQNIALRLLKVNEKALPEKPDA